MIWILAALIFTCVWVVIMCLMNIKLRRQQHRDVRELLERWQAFKDVIKTGRSL